jgi:NADH:ubiquinone oxidoreductase subunit 5 (subunit L)/multisubunit Na+/H+ antiporter MnhA subunit
VHVQARRYAADGHRIVLIGHAGHEEVVGTMGEAPDVTVLVESVEDAEALERLAGYGCDFAQGYFIGRPTEHPSTALSPEAREAHEAPLTMRVAMVFLATLCALLGLGAAVVVPCLGAILAGYAGLPSGAPALTSGSLLLPPGGTTSMSPSLVGLGLLLVMGGAWLAVRLGAARGLRVGDTWGCGRIGQTPRMEYTSTAYAEPLRRVFAELYRPTEDLAIDVHPESRYFVQSIAYRSAIVPWFERCLYGPLVARVAGWAARTRVIQSGSAHAYLGYLVVALVVLLAITLAGSG